MALGLARAVRQAGGGERRIRFGREGILDLFGVKDPQRADLWRVQDALSVAGLGLAPSLPQADDDEPVQVWLASERLARQEPSTMAQAFAPAGGGRFEPAGGRRLDRRSAQTLAALLPGVLLPVIGVAVLGPAFAIAFLVLAIALGAVVRWRAAVLAHVRWPFGALGAASPPRVLGGSLVAVSGAMFVASAMLGQLVVSRLATRDSQASAEAPAVRAGAREAARDRARLETQADRGRALAVERGLDVVELRARVSTLERRVRVQRRRARAAARRSAAAAVPAPFVAPVEPPG